MIKRCPICDSRDFIVGKYGCRCNNCGYINKYKRAIGEKNNILLLAEGAVKD